MRRLFSLSIVLVLTLVFALSPANAQGGQTYVVQPGDTLFSIAARFGVGVSELATINGLYDVNVVFVGQVLRLPTSARPTQPTQPIVYPPQPFYPQPFVYPPGTTVTTVTTYTGYIVQPGDNLAKIAERFRTTIAAIMAANGIANPNFIYVGQRLTIPRTRTTVVPRPRVHVPLGRLYYVQRGDTLFSIAARFRRNAWDIARANGILNLNAIYVGQALIIP